jgi:hypothetical protein
MDRQRLASPDLEGSALRQREEVGTWQGVRASSREPRMGWMAWNPSLRLATQGPDTGDEDEIGGRWWRLQGRMAG